MTLTAERRGEIEREIVTKIIDKALSLNVMISVNNGGDEDEITKSQVKDDILKAMFATDAELILLHSQGGIALGEIYFIYGNDGYDVVANYSANELTEMIVEAAQDLVQKYELESQ